MGILNRLFGLTESVAAMTEYDNETIFESWKAYKKKQLLKKNK